MTDRVADLLGIPQPKARGSADAPPPGFFDDGPDLGDAAEPRGTVTPHPKKLTQAEFDRSRIVWGDALDVDPEPIAFVSTGFRAAPGRPSVICGEGGTKKSLLLQYLLACVATGLPFFGRHAVMRGKALFMDFEQGLNLSRARMRRFARGMGFSLAEHKDRIAYIERPFFLDDIERASDRLADLVHGFTLVGVDSAFRCAPRLRQNDAEAAIPFEIMTRASLRTGATFVVADHASTKRDPDARRKSMQSGNHHKLDGAGTIYTLTSEKHDGRWLPTHVTCEREQLDGDRVEDFAFDVVDVLDPDVAAAHAAPYTRDERKWGLMLKEFGIEACKPPPKPKAVKADDAGAVDQPPLFQIGMRIVELVKAQPGISSGELLDVLKMRKQRFNEAVAMLVRDGKMTNRTGKANRTEWVAT